MGDGAGGGLRNASAWKQHAAVAAAAAHAPLVPPRSALFAALSHHLFSSLTMLSGSILKPLSEHFFFNFICIPFYLHVCRHTTCADLVSTEARRTPVIVVPDSCDSSYG